MLHYLIHFIYYLAYSLKCPIKLTVKDWLPEIPQFYGFCYYEMAYWRLYILQFYNLYVSLNDIQCWVDNLQIVVCYWFQITWQKL